MTFDEYQKQSTGTAQYSSFTPPWVYLGLSMEDVAQANRAKLDDRKTRDVIKSRGDNR